jgi:predicted nucleotidyltransferase
MPTLTELSEVMRPVFASGPVARAFIFGSCAKGTATNGSDVDIVIDSDGALTGFDFFVYSDKLMRTLPIKADIFEYSEIKKPSALHSKIMNEGIIIYERA